jgi:hypothetical protein
MIAKDLKRICKDDISKIENYEQAINDKENMWVCHHRLELTLDGEFAHSAEELDRLGMYYNRPYFELIFLTRTQHGELHGGTLTSEDITKRLNTAECKNKMRNAKIGRKRGPMSEETKKKIAEARKGKPHPHTGGFQSDEKRAKISKIQKGRKLSEETRQKNVKV